MYYSNIKIPKSTDPECYFLCMEGTPPSVLSFEMRLSKGCSRLLFIDGNVIITIQQGFKLKGKGVINLSTCYSFRYFDGTKFLVDM